MLCRAICIKQWQKNTVYTHTHCIYTDIVILYIYIFTLYIYTDIDIDSDRDRDKDKDKNRDRDDLCYLRKNSCNIIFFCLNRDFKEIKYTYNQGEWSLNN